MELIADILLVAGALGAGLYCFVLARRLKRFTDLEKGVGGAVSVLSAQASELKNSLDVARQASDQSGVALEALTQRAEAAAKRLELLMASMHDVLPDEHKAPEPEVDPTHSDTSPTEIPEESESASEDLAPSAPAAPQTNAPEGLMFFRHMRPESGAAE